MLRTDKTTPVVDSRENASCALLFFCGLLISAPKIIICGSYPIFRVVAANVLASWLRVAVISR